MSLAFETPQADHHALSTRLVHAGLALSICTQLASSLIMQGPSETSMGDAIFQIHRYAGFAALTFALLFWLALTFRKHRCIVARCRFCTASLCHVILPLADKCLYRLSHASFC